MTVGKNLKIGFVLLAPVTQGIAGLLGVRLVPRVIAFIVQASSSLRSISQTKLTTRRTPPTTGVTRMPRRWSAPTSPPLPRLRPSHRRSLALVLQPPLAPSPKPRSKHRSMRACLRLPFCMCGTLFGCNKPLLDVVALLFSSATVLCYFCNTVYSVDIWC